MSYDTMMSATATEKFRESLRRFSKAVWSQELYYERPLDDDVKPVLEKNMGETA
jgi:hypothetical protein